MKTQKIQTPILIKAALTTGLLLAAASVNAEIFRVVDEDGNVTYTDQPPPSATAENIAPTLREAEQSNTLPSPETQRANDPEWVKDLREEREQQKKADAKKESTYQHQLKEWRKSVSVAEQNLKTAIKAQAKGIEAMEGDFVGNTSGGARPSEQYMRRQQKLAENVDDARKALKKIKKQKPRRNTSQ